MFNVIENVHFQGQDPDEKIILFLRKHVITNLSWIIGSILLVVLPFFLDVVIQLVHIPVPGVPTRFIPVIIAVYYLFVSLYGITQFINWTYNVFIVTPKRIVDIDFSDVIYQDVAIANIEEVEDVHYKQGGFLRSIFNYGDLFLQTQGDKANFEAYQVPNPGNAAHTILQLTGKAGGKDD